MFSVHWCDEEGPQRILGVALHSHIKLLKYMKLFLHIDATFQETPWGSYHVVMFIFSIEPGAWSTYSGVLLPNDKEIGGSIQHLVEEHNYLCLLVLDE